MEEIKVTLEQFDEAVNRSMREFGEIGSKSDEDGERMMANLMMTLQNAAFASLIRKNLFKTENK